AEESLESVETSIIDIGHHRRVDEWRSELAELLARGRSAYGDAEVREFLKDALEGLARVQPSVQPLAPLIAVLGVSACDAGWVGVLVRPSGRTTLHVGSSLIGLIEQVRDQETLGAVGLWAGARTDEAAVWLNARLTVEAVEVVDPDAASEALESAGLTLPAMYSGMGFELEELRIAGAAVIAASRLFS
ncbi:MAG TPA: hypothetical protein VN108_11790, partial [Marmoricola sp.]|nr:hypothetical protein [Marmoricola sp.]